MKYINIIIFVIFVFFIAFVVAIFNLLIGLLILGAFFGGAVLIYLENENARDCMGVIVAHIGSNNNWRLGIMAILTLICFFIAFKTGPGKPVLITAYQDLVKEANQYVDDQEIESTNKKIYTFFWGEKKAKEKYEKIKNNKNAEPNTKSWFWWKLSFAYLFFTILYIIPAFSDEVLGFINDAIIRIKNMKDEFKLRPPPEPTAPEDTAAGTAKTTPFYGTKIGWFGRLYGSELASEFTIRLLQGFARLFSKL